MSTPPVLTPEAQIAELKAEVTHLQSRMVYEVAAIAKRHEAQLATHRAIEDKLYKQIRIHQLEDAIRDQEKQVEEQSQELFYLRNQLTEAKAKNESPE